PPMKNRRALSTGRADAVLKGRVITKPSNSGAHTFPPQHRELRPARLPRILGIGRRDSGADAPDLGADPTPSAELPGPVRQSNAQTAAARSTPNRSRPEAATRSVLGDQLSASLRESLIEQLASINSADEAAAWAHRNLPAKNKLTAGDAKMVERRFQAR